MIRKEIIDLIASRTKITKRDLIEKDLILHRLLVELTSNKHFAENYAFKGGTCLMKCYLGYYRFSEDLDFTYINQEEFDKKSEKQKRRILSEKISLILKILEGISNKIGLDFKAAKGNLRYVEFGGSNKQTTFKLWYAPEGQTEEAFIKIQINFIEKLEYSIIEKHADNIFFGKYGDFELAFLLPEDSEWVLKIPILKCYDIREILLEKVRAILTRKGIKERDFLDIYMIENNKKLDIRDFKEQIIEKTKAMLRFEKYRNNLSKRLENKIDLKIGEEEKLLLIPIPEIDLEKFLLRFNLFLQEIIKELSGEKK